MRKPTPDSTEMWRFTPETRAQHSHMSVDFLIERYGDETVYRMAGTTKEIPRETVYGWITAARKKEARLFRVSYYKAT